ncbi:hypothetical protein D3C78_1392520 [compost metagenome]
MFLYGGISPKQLFLVFLFYLFIMFVLGSFGILFSSLFKKTMISVIVTYGVTLFIFGGTAIVFFVLMGVVDQLTTHSTTQNFSWMGHVLAWNPVAAMYSILEPEFSQQAFTVNMGSSPNKNAPLELWQEFMIIYTVLAGLALWLGIRRLRPRLNSRK